MKRFIALILCLIMVFALAACGQEAAPAAAPAAQEAAPAAEAPAAETIVLKANHAVAETHPYHLGLLKFAELVNERTNGQVVVEVHSQAELGDERASIESLQMGTLDVLCTSTGPVGNFVPDFLVLDLPYLFPDTETARAVLDSEIGEGLLGQLQDLGITGAAFWENGFRQLTNSKNPINTLADCKGLKIRCMENEIHQAAFSAMGLNAEPYAWAEVFTMLQTKAFDGQENPIAIIASSKIYEVNQYMAITNHVYSPSALLISNMALAKLDQATQDILLQAAKEAGTYERDLLTQSEQENIKICEENGMTVTYPDLTEFIEVARSVYPKYADRFSDGLLDAVLAATSK